jgi:hypothetical protein
MNEAERKLKQINRRRIKPPKRYQKKRKISFVAAQRLEAAVEGFDGVVKRLEHEVENVAGDRGEPDWVLCDNGNQNGEQESR